MANEPSERGMALAEAALSLLGVRFRLHGRHPETGLDCIGVLAAALRACGHEMAMPGDYRLRMRDLSRAWEWAGRHGFQTTEGAHQAGDVLMFAVGPEQGHLAIAVTAGEFVHAHAGLRKVVCSAAGEDWSIAGHWRLAPGNDG